MRNSVPPWLVGQKKRLELADILQERLSRRQLLRYGGLSGLSLSAFWAVACQQAAPTATPTKAPTTAVPTATAAAAAPTATKAPATTPTPEKIGKALIGKLEGPEYITDPAKMPKTFKESPQFAELVKAGKLPPVKERIGEEPLVIKPVHEAGKYGGTWRRGFIGAFDNWNGFRLVLGQDKVLYRNYTNTKVVPNLAKGWEITDGGKTTLIYLRKGVKWADGQPFTADDFAFQFQDILLNKDLNPTLTPLLTINFKPGVVEKVDTYTVRFTFPEPYYMIPDFLSSNFHISGHGATGYKMLGAYAPAHYLKQFHPKYVSKEELDKKVKDAKFDNWVTFIKFKNSSELNSELPNLNPYRTTTPINTPTWVLEPNPYNWSVDTDGNQLPYIDKVSMTLSETTEILNLRAIAGEYDMQERHMDLMKLPVLIANQQKGGYKLYLDPLDQGTDAYLGFNMTYEADLELNKWFNNVDFRRALSLGIERDQLNEVFWLGVGTPGNAVPPEDSLYSPGPDSTYRTMWATYDPKKANEMLDKIGLDKKDAEGFRLRTDGKGRLRIEIQTFMGFVPFTQIMEMVVRHWKKIGIDAVVNEAERGLATKRRMANECQIYVDCQWGAGDMFGHTPNFFPFVQDTAFGPLYGLWFSSGGERGKEPPPRMKEMMGMYRKAFGVPLEERIKLAKEIWKIVADEIWSIGTVGLSPAGQGVRVAKVGMGNMPARLLSSSSTDGPVITRPETFYWKT